MAYKTLITTLVFCFLVGALGFLLAQKTNLTTADLGRHVKNGELLWNSINRPSGGAQGGPTGQKFWQSDVLYKNTYSYTHPDFEVPNHHWLSGIVFYLVFQMAGLSGLSIFYIALLAAAFAIVFGVCIKLAGWKSSVLAGLMIIPLIAYRHEVRPEGFTYLFSAVFIGILYYWTTTPKTKLIWLLPVVEILWVNTHVYFFLGPAIVGAFLLGAALQGESLFRRFGRNPDYSSGQRIPLVMFGLSVLAMLINPFGLKGAVYPFTIFSNYGYRVLENQTVWFLQKLGIDNPVYLLFEVVAGLVAVLLIYMTYKSYMTPHRSYNQVWTYTSPTLSYIRRGTNGQLWMIFLALGGLCLGLFAVRNFAVFGLFVLPLLAYAMHRLLSGKYSWLRTLPVYASLLLTVLFGQLLLFYQTEQAKQPIRGFGLLPNISRAAEFINKNDIKGPIFNNYDIGGYLIFYTYPKLHVFTDNRPESYPKNFFSDIYIPMQEQETIWKTELDKHQFNTIIFYYHDATPWAQKFLINRTRDEAWAAVYVDSYILILTKRGGLNQKVIDTFELPTNMFRTR